MFYLLLAVVVFHRNVQMRNNTYAEKMNIKNKPHYRNGKKKTLKAESSACNIELLVYKVVC